MVTAVEVDEERGRCQARGRVVQLQVVGPLNVAPMLGLKDKEEVARKKSNKSTCPLL